MSVDATIATWRLTKKQVTPTQKLLLLAYSDRAGERFECWPSNTRLEIDTGLDRHTICENKQQLIDKKLISYTGEKKGRTKSIDVIRLLYIIPREGFVDELDESSSVEMPIASNVSSVEMPIAKQCGFAHTEPKRLEPKIKTKEKINKKEKSVDQKYKETYYPKPENKSKNITIQTIQSFNPHNLTEQMIADWIENRRVKKSAITLTAWERINKELNKCKNPISAFEECVGNGWIGFNASWLEENKNKKSLYEKNDDILERANKGVFEL